MTSAARRSSTRAVLVLNAGSSTLKCSIVRPGRDEPLAAATARWRGDPVQSAGETLAGLADRLGVSSGSGIAAVGHRVVYGGAVLRSPVLVDERVLAILDGLAQVAPLHNPVAVATIRAAWARWPKMPHVACFDTAFHATLPATAVRYPVPERWLTDWGIRRFGFHGLSVEWSVRRAAQLLGERPSRLRMVVAHLGAGCSVTAVDRGRSAWTSMGYTPLEGLMMATRAGSIDPGAIVRLLRDGNLSVAEMDRALEHESGLLAVGGSPEMRELLERARARDERARLAIAMLEDRAAAGIAAAATRLDRLDALVFTGGIGENAGAVRAGIVRRLGVLGLRRIRATRATRDRRLSREGDRPAVLRIAAREDLVIATAATRLAGIA